jgi:ketosteroid isomerase-like protein
MPAEDLQEMVRAYLEAFERRDLPRCLEFFADDAAITFALSVYRGKQAIEEWHKDRFSADLRVVRVERIRSHNGAVVVDAVATSKVARAWRFASVSGTVTLVFDGSKIKEAKFGLRTPLPLEGW